MVGISEQYPVQLLSQDIIIASESQSPCALGEWEMCYF